MRLKTAAMVLLAIMTVSGWVYPAAAQPTTVHIKIDGQELVTDVAPVIRFERTMVPLRAIGEGLGMHVGWDAANRFVLVSKDEAGLTAPDGETGSSETSIRIFLDGCELTSDVAPFILEDRTMVPLRVISEGMGMDVEWDPVSYEVNINRPAEVIEEPDPEAADPDPVLPDPDPTDPIAAVVDYETGIMGEAQVSAEQLRTLLKQNNPSAPDLVDLYLSIGAEYGVRGDIAFCQAAKETGWWRFTGLVQPWQNNYCGLGATGAAATGEEDLLGADASRIRYEAGVHGAIFTTPADGVEAQIQHLYAYATRSKLPAGKVLVDPRFAKVTRGCAPQWIDLGGRWAYPGYDRNKYSSFEEAFTSCDTYGHSILKHYYAKIFTEQ